MFVERLLPAARKRLVIIKDDVPVIEAAKLLLDCDTDILVVRGGDELLAGVITKTDIVRQNEPLPRIEVHSGGIECHDTDCRPLPTERRIVQCLVHHEGSWPEEPPRP